MRRWPGEAIATFRSATRRAREEDAFGRNVHGFMAAPTLTRPREAKKVIANLSAAPGRVDVTTSEIRVRLSSAADRSEHLAIQQLLANITVRRLTLPGNVRNHPLRFERSGPRSIAMA